MASISPASVAGRRESSSSRTTDGKDVKKDEKVILEESKPDDIEEVNYKKMLNRFVSTSKTVSYYVLISIGIEVDAEDHSPYIPRYTYL